MVVDVEDRRPQPLIGQPLRGDGHIVEIAIAAEDVAAGVMAGRARQREGAALALMDRLCAALSAVLTAACAASQLPLVIGVAVSKA